MTVYDKESVTFYYDWKNVRLIVIDQYAPYAKGLSNKTFLDWLEKAILSAKNADHVFIAFHEPHFPPVFKSYLFGIIPSSTPTRSGLRRHFTVMERYRVRMLESS